MLLNLLFSCPFIKNNKIQTSGREVFSKFVNSFAMIGGGLQIIIDFGGHSKLMASCQLALLFLHRLFEISYCLDTTNL